MLPFEVQYNRSEYKKDTKYIADYLLNASWKCGYRSRVVTESSKEYDIYESEFEPMAQAVADNASSITIPEYLHIIFTRAIRFRREVMAWYRVQHSASREDAQHDAFADRLEATLTILRPHMPHIKRTKDAASASKTTSLGNQFSELQLSDIIEDDEEDIQPQVEVEDPPSVPTVRIGADESDSEESFFMEIRSFLKELGQIAGYVLSLWGLKEKDLITKAVLTNTAIDLVRRKEIEFDQSLVRPLNYPAARFPTWCLPAVLLYKDADLEPNIKEFTLEHIALPSYCILNFNTLSEESYVHAIKCFYPAYSGLKLFLWALNEGNRGASPGLLAFTLENLKNEANQSDVVRTVEWAQTLLFTNHNFMNMLPEDEVTRGIWHVCETQEVPLWVTFGMQILVSLQDLLGDSIGEAFEEMQRDLVETSCRFEKVRGSEHATDVGYKDEVLRQIPEHLHSFKSFLKGDHLVTEMRRRAKVGGHLLLLDAQTGALLKERHYFWINHHLRCGLIKYYLKFITRNRALDAERTHCYILTAAHLYNILPGFVPRLASLA